MNRKDYVIEVYRAGHTAWLSLRSDEDEPGTLFVTSHEVMALRYASHAEARSALAEAVKNHPETSFRLGVLAPMAA